MDQSAQGSLTATGPRSANVTWHGLPRTRDERVRLLGHAGATLWFTGLSASGKSTIASAVEAELLHRRRPALMLDGDNLRHGLNGDLGFTPEDRSENLRRVAHVAGLLAHAGVVAVVSLVSPYRADRERARRLHAEADIPFFEIWVSTPVEVCEQRDPKGLYARARRGEIPDFTGISAPYEEPEQAELVLDPCTQSVDEAVAAVLAVTPA